ncbi:MAG: sigma-70 family RNA polymerase sigma factor [Sedimentisphaerales bacterium]|nr:sigma-70 family RNA polymerase sigma factor [Sedimentisphaerales bacterium]
MWQYLFLVRKLKYGREQALREIYERYKDNLFTMAVLLLGATDDAAEILHDVFVGLAKDVQQLSFWPKLSNQLIVRVAEAIRKKFSTRMYEIRQFDRRPEGAFDFSHHDLPAATDEQGRMLLDALGRIRFDRKEVIILYLRGELSFRQIAKLQGTSASMARARYYNGLDEVRSFLRDKAIG